MKSVNILVFNNFLRDGRVEREANSLQNVGYRVRVIALHEGNLPEYSEQRGLHVYRIKLSSRKLPKHPIIQIFKWLELFIRIFLQHGKADIYHVCDTLPLPVAMLIKTFRNRQAKIVYDAHELEFDKNTDNPMIGNIIRKIEARFVRKVDAFMTVSPQIAQTYAEYYNIPAPAAVMNCPNKIEVKKQNIFREKFGIHEHQTIVLYQGLLKPNRGLEQMFTAMPALSDNFAFVILGYAASDDYLNKIKEQCHKQANCYFHDAVTPDVLLNYTASADVGLFMIQATNRSHEMAVGNKIFEYIQAGIPVISSNLSGAKTVINNETGYILPDDSPAAVRLALETILANGKDYYKSGLQAAADIYIWENQEKIMLQLYANL